MRNPFRSVSRPSTQDRDITVESKAFVDTEPLPYMQRQRIHPSTDLWGVGTQAIKHCLIWRMAVDWNLERHVPRAQRPIDHEYSRFERCCANYGRVLGNHYKPNILHIIKTHLDQFVLIPGERLGIGVNLLEFFMFSVRRVTLHPEYTSKPKRIAIQHKPNRITNRRDEVLLLRLIIDSKTFVDLLTDSQSTFALKLKAKCAKLHTEQFSWLLDPTHINIDPVLDSRTPSILSNTHASGHWPQVEWLMQQALRPCASVMEPYLSAAYVVVQVYLLPQANLVQQPEFFERIATGHVSKLPVYVICNGYQWYNFDQMFRVFVMRGNELRKEWSNKPFSNEWGGRVKKRVVHRREGESIRRIKSSSSPTRSFFSRLKSTSSL